MKNTSQLVPVILCGGSGTRLWPLSRSSYPKQLLSLVDDMTLLQNTILRTANHSPESANTQRDELEKQAQLKQEISPVIICNEAYRFLVAEQVRQIGYGHADIILEPVGRNTAPAVAIAALHQVKQGFDPILLVMPADHVMLDKHAFLRSIEKAKCLAEQGYLVTLGVVPTRAETGYGYIQKGEEIEHGFRVKQFVEKPHLEKAQSYFQSGQYFWNSGMFVFSASRYLAELKQLQPEIYQHCEASYAKQVKDLDFIRLDESFEASPNISIDYAVMEHAEQIAVVPLESDWSDVGSWHELWEIAEKDSDGNVLIGQVYAENVNRSYLRSQKRVLAVLGVQDVAVIETDDAVLVAHRDHCQQIKEVVSRLKFAKRSETEEHPRVHRPWGFYETLSLGEGYQVKHILVKPHAKLSLQMHQHRAEHWVIVKGRATIVRDLDRFELSENQSVYIPKFSKHRIENLSDEPLELIEVQTGTYLGEDDIIRFSDEYGR